MVMIFILMSGVITTVPHKWDYKANSLIKFKIESIDIGLHSKNKIIMDVWVDDVRGIMNKLYRGRVVSVQGKYKQVQRGGITYPYIEAHQIDTGVRDSITRKTSKLPFE